jgi:hypothetical protein
MAALDPALLGAWLEGGIELIDQRLKHRLEQFAGRGKDQFPKLPFEVQPLLLGRLSV